MAGRLGDILIQRGLLTEDQLAEGLALQRSAHRLLGDILLDRQWVTRDQLGEALSVQYDVPFCAIDANELDPQVIRLLPEGFARENKLVPLEVSAGVMTLSMVAPDDIQSISETELITGYHVEPTVSFEDDVQQALDRGFDDTSVARQTIVDMKLTELHEADENGVEATDDFQMGDEDAPVIRLVKATLAGAINVDASDIHVEPHTPEMRVRYRVDGELQQVMTIPRHIEEAVVARIKVMADMDTTETRKPQDGHISFTEDGSKVNFRVSTIPCTGGEKIVMRLLDEGNKVFLLDKIGFNDMNIKKVHSMLDKPHGMILITGPTGSGKSTTMYAMLTELNKIERNIVTVEDPVEYRLAGINQVQSDNQFGMGFANALKYIMRQDPDVIMVGEIRDHETAGIGVQAALTGHLLISTLHTNDAVGAVPRLNDLGIDEFKIGGSLLGAIAQRLLRTICPECKTLDKPRDSLLEAVSAGLHVPKGAQFYRGEGCGKCLGTGYSGRMPIFEVFTVTTDVAMAIEAKQSAGKIREIAVSGGMQELRGSGLEAAMAGKTTLEEVYFKTSS